MSIRPVKRVTQSRPTMEGAGVRLRRAFGFGDTSDFDPFLMMDDFRGDRPEDYQAGFPWHPHRGIETITYVLAGSVDHGDSLGNRGKLGAGDVQWMTAGSGILHQEMPTGDAERPHARLPALGQLALAAQDDQAALPGRSRVGDPRSDRRRRHARARHLRRFLGQVGPGRRRRRRAPLSRRDRAGGKTQAAQGRGFPPGLRLHLRGVGHIRSTRRSLSACCGRRR